MAINSRQKGKRFELALACKLREHGYECRRGQQYCGANGDADVVGLPGIHIEAKAVEKLNLYDAMAQAKHDAREDELPTVFHKKNNCKILVTMELDDWIKLYREWEAGRGE
jgi:Holliday junction resolvase